MVDADSFFAKNHPHFLNFTNLKLRLARRKDWRIKIVLSIIVSYKRINTIGENEFPTYKIFGP